MRKGEWRANLGKGEEENKDTVRKGCKGRRGKEKGKRGKGEYRKVYG